MGLQVCPTTLSLCPVGAQTLGPSKYCANWAIFQVEAFCVFILQFSCLEIQSYGLHNLVLFQGTLRILEEENHIKDVLSRIVVEMIKREWPQHWPDMLMELDTLSRQGVWTTRVLATWACVRAD